MSYRGNTVLKGTTDTYRRVLHRARNTLLIILPLLLLPISAQAVYTTPGSFEVNPDGSAGYTIPIQVPPGTAGMAPKLSLAYNSNGGNGPLGMGWSLEGLSQIGRCPKTMAQDGVRGGVNLDSNDRYCLDGQRLIATGGTYGADGTEYRSELANFARIVSYGQAENGPAWFKVWTKGGQILEYGNTADSRIEAQGKPTVLTWSVNKIADTKGNYLTVSYTEDNANGETLVSRIDYTGNATTTPALTPYASVQFTYETRPDPSIAYLAGSLIKSTKRMTNVKTYAGATLVKDYRLTYESSPLVNKSRLKTITECALDNACLSAISLAWSSSSAGFGSPAQWMQHGGTFQAGKTQYADVNGDGRSDLIFQGNNNEFYVSLSTGSQFQSAALWMQHGGTFQAGKAQYADVNGDGRSDLIFQGNNNEFYVSLSTGSQFQSAALWMQHGGTFQAGKAQYADVNGDGRSDLIFQGYNNEFYVSLSTGSQFLPAALWMDHGSTFEPGHAQYSDVNGDGMADLIFQATNNGFWVSLSAGTQFLPAVLWFQHGPSFENSQAAYTDLNADGMADLLFQASDNQFWVSLATSNSFLPTSVWGDHGGSIEAGHAQYDDVNGDGRPDLLFQGNDNKFWVSLQNGIQPDQLLSITNSFNGSVTLTYKPLTDSSVYAKDSGANAATYPIQDIQSPMYVVSSVSTSDGLGGNVVTNYIYGGAKVDLNGRGFLGFRWTKAVSPDTGIDLTTFYHQGYPYIGLPSQSEKRTSAGVLLSAVANTYANSPVTTGSAVSQFPYVSQTQELNYELDGSLVTNSTTSYQYDGYGNATQVTVNSNDGFIKTTANLYANDVPNWLLGRLLRSSVTTTSP